MNKRRINEIEFNDKLIGSIREYMDQNNITIKEAAESIGINRNTLSSYLNGTSPVPISVLIRLHNRKGINFWGIFDDFYESSKFFNDKDKNNDQGKKEDEK